MIGINTPFIDWAELMWKLTGTEGLFVFICATTFTTTLAASTSICWHSNCDIVANWPTTGSPRTTSSSDSPGAKSVSLFLGRSFLRAYNGFFNNFLTLLNCLTFRIVVVCAPLEVGSPGVSSGQPPVICEKYNSIFTSVAYFGARLSSILCRYPT